MCISTIPHIPGHCPPGAPMDGLDFTKILEPVEQLTVKLVLSPGAKAPEYKTSEAAGADIFTNESHDLMPGEVHMYTTGVYVQIPRGYEGQVRSRSGLAGKNQVFVLNSPGTIDSDYRGEIKVILKNVGNERLLIKAGDRIAQLVVKPVEQAHFQVVETLETSARGENGFGSTGR